MITSMKPLLAAAQADRQAVGSFNVYSYETVRGVLEAGAKTGKPVIVAFGERYLENMGFDTLVGMCTTVAAGLDVEYAIHLDHCKSLDHVYQAIHAGFTSVMYDGSALPFAENATNTAAVVKVAHALGVSVEAELGSLASGTDSQESEDNDQQVYTDPAEAAEFVALTGCDALAVSIGTVHGAYKGTPNIRLDILDGIRAAVDTPLVLHGGSGTPEDVIADCIRGGITKINVNTEISMHASAQLKAFLADAGTPHLSVISNRLVDYVAESVTAYIHQFAN
jgi:fructose-bisphosphate aldolase class II